MVRGEPLAVLQDEIDRLHQEKDEAQRQEHMALNEEARLRRVLVEIEDYGNRYAHRTQHLKAIALKAYEALHPEERTIQTEPDRAESINEANPDQPPGGSR